MSKASNKRVHRLAIPLHDWELKLIQEAAELRGLAFTTYARQLLVRRSQNSVEKHSLNREMSSRDADRLASAIDSPPKLNALREASNRHSVDKRAASPTPASDK